MCGREWQGTQYMTLECTSRSYSFWIHTRLFWTGSRVKTRLRPPAGSNLNRYEATILPNDELEMVLDSTDADADGSPDLYMRHSETSRFMFIGLPIIFAAALGGLYEALWKRREISSTSGNNGSNTSGNAQEAEDNKPGIFSLLHNVVHYQYRPLGRYSP